MGTRNLAKDYRKPRKPYAEIEHINEPLETLEAPDDLCEQPADLAKSDTSSPEEPQQAEETTAF